MSPPSSADQWATAGLVIVVGLLQLLRILQANRKDGKLDSFIAKVEEWRLGVDRRIGDLEKRRRG